MAKKKNMNPLEKVAKRFGITTREARDIATAVSTLGRTAVDPNVRGRGLDNIRGRKIDITKRGKLVGRTYRGSEIRAKAARNLAKQVGEVYTAATKGKSGTKSAEIKSIKQPKSGLTFNERYETETKRKQGSKK
jgi:hypothetical protein